MRDQRGQTPADVLAKQKRAAVVSWLVTTVCYMQKCVFLKWSKLVRKRLLNAYRIFDRSVQKVLMRER